MKHNDIKSAVQSVLTPDLLKPYWRDLQEKKGNKLIGHCYVATEACFYLLGGTDGSFDSYTLNYKTFPEGLKEGETHWFLKKGGFILDPTAEQFDVPVPYDNGRRQVFLTKKPSKRTEAVIERVKKMGDSGGDLMVDWATYAAAKYACENWHYSGCMPVGKLVKVGAWEDKKFIGVVLFGRGAAPNLGRPYGLGQDECVELVRIALTKHRCFVSKIMAMSVNLLKQTNPKLKLIVTFADRSQGHHGGIYQATNWIYGGQGQAARFYKIKGKLTHPRSIGAKGFVQNLDGAKRIDKNAEEVLIPGKHRYLMPLDKKMRKQILPLSKPYPKREP